MKKSDLIIPSIGALIIILVVWLAIVTQGRWDECRGRGGYPVDTKNGWVCAKLEII